MATPIEVTISNGEKVQINDHVYVSPSWAQRDGIPYSIARIMEFLPPEGSAKGKGKGKEIYTRVRLAWYYRPSDLSDRQVSDSRLLLAAIFSEIQPLSYVRAKCYVRHKDKITDLIAWKKEPDRFYFFRLFDPYIKKEYEVLLSRDVNNVPQNIKDVLTSRYEYVIVEKEAVPDMTDSIRLCKTCSQWCPGLESVRCDICKHYFHMACVQPPLAAKPTKGYGWTCAPCSRKHDEDVDRQAVRSDTPTRTTRMGTRARARTKTSGDSANGANRKPEEKDRSFKMWPFRYFGVYTVAEDTLDPDDFIFPRAATRIGPRFQSNLPRMLDPNAPLPEPEHPDLPSRGGDDTIEVLGCVPQMTESEVNEFEEQLKNLIGDSDQEYFQVDLIEEAVRRLSVAYGKDPFTSVKLKGTKRPRRWQKSDSRFYDKDWTEDEIRTFEKGIEAHGAELGVIKSEVKTRTVPEVVRFYGHWKNTQLGEINKKATTTPNGSPVKPISEQANTVEPTFERESSIVNPSLEKTHSRICCACKSHNSDYWWKAPRGYGSSVMCQPCAVAWRKYGEMKSARVDEAAKAKATVEKREGTPLAQPTAKRVKGSSNSSTPPPPHLQCQCCMQSGPLGGIVKCNQCSLTVHAASNGVTIDQSEASTWLCDLCENQKSLECSLNPSCLLCPRVAPSKNAHKISHAFLRASKPTEGQGWVHTVCSVFMPELQYTDAAVLRAVEGISTIAPWRWASSCKICGTQEGGAVIKCDECPAEFHIGCAWKAGCHFRFELQHTKGSRGAITFREETGIMQPIVLCNLHSLQGRPLIRLCDKNTNGETALQLYCQTYKQVPLEHSYALLRKARRLDSVLDVPSLDDPPPPPSKTAPLDRHCVKCKTQFSPMFYPVSSSSPDAPRTFLCHQCKLKPAPEVNGFTNGTNGV